MKKILFLCLMATCVVSCNNSGNTENQTTERIIQTTTMENPRFKMIETENIHILLKWDTRTGKTWMVQYGLRDTPALEKLIPNSLPKIKAGMVVLNSIRPKICSIS